MKIDNYDIFCAVMFFKHYKDSHGPFYSFKYIISYTVLFDTKNNAEQFAILWWNFRILHNPILPDMCLVNAPWTPGSKPMFS